MPRPRDPGAEIALPAASGPLAALLKTRRTRRVFGDGPVGLDAIARLMFAAQGVCDADGRRTVPSAGAKYPLELRLAAARVEGLSPGLYRYDAAAHALVSIAADAETESPLPGIAAATFEAPWVADAAAAILISAAFARTTTPYAEQPPPGRAERYVWLEAGHAAQALALAAAEAALAAVLVGGFDDDAMATAFRLPGDERPIGLLPVGRI